MAEEKDGEQKKEEESESSELAKGKDKELETSKPEEVLEEFEQMPTEVKKNFSKMISMFMSSGPMPHPIFSKMNTEQVGKVIDYIEEDSKRDHKNRMSERRYSFTAFVIILLFILALAAGCFWKDKLEYIAPILTAIVGFGGGYGVGVARQKNNG